MMQPWHVLLVLNVVKLNPGKSDPPTEEQVCPLRSDPSHSSDPSRTPLPQTPVHPDVLKPLHPARHPSVPPVPPRPAHVWPARSAPSHTSFPSRTPFPHTA